MAQAFAVAEAVASGVFNPAPATLLTNVTAVGLAAADFNRDGRADLALAAAGAANRLLVFCQRPDGYGWPADYSIPLENAPRALAVGDFDGDGIPDVAATTRNWLWIFTGQSGYADGGRYVSGFPNNNQGGRAGLIARRLPSQPAGMDFMVGPVFRRWRGGRNMRNGYFYGPQKNNNGALALGDLDGDGSDDAVFNVMDENKLRLYYGPFPGKDVRPEQLNIFLELQAPAGAGLPLLGDLDDDGRLDIAVCGREPATGEYGVHIYLQNSPLDFTPDSAASVIISGGALPLKAVLADLNGDGLEDVLALETRRRPARLFALLQRFGRAWPECLADADQIITIDDSVHNLWMIAGAAGGGPEAVLAAGDPAPDRLLVLRNIGAPSAVKIDP